MLLSQAINGVRTAEELYNKYVKTHENVSYANMVCSLQYDCIANCLKFLSLNLKGEHEDTNCICCLAEDFMEENKKRFEEDEEALPKNKFIRENVCPNIRMFNSWSNATQNDDFDVSFDDIERGLCICKNLIGMCDSIKCGDPNLTTHNLNEEKHFHEKCCLR